MDASGVTLVLIGPGSVDQVTVKCKWLYGSNCDFRSLFGTALLTFHARAIPLQARTFVEQTKFKGGMLQKSLSQFWILTHH